MIRNLINLGGILLEWYIACSLYGVLHPRRFSKKTSLLLGALCVGVQFTGNALFLGKSSALSSIMLLVFSFVFGFLLALLYYNASVLKARAFRARQRTKRKEHRHEQGNQKLHAHRARP